MKKIPRGHFREGLNTYEAFLAHIYKFGKDRSDRTGTGTRGIFGYQMRFDLFNGLPVVTTKKVHLKSIIAELLWFISGSTNVKPLREMGCTIWDEWADENGDLGPVYGHQWRSWPTPDGNRIDQLSSVLEALKTDPFSRRHVVSAWNVSSLGDMALPPCHLLFQFHVRELSWSERVTCFDIGDPHLKTFTGKDWEENVDGPVGRYMKECGVPELGLSCQLYQRSADAFLGVPFNITSYALLTNMIAAQLGYAPLEFIWTGGDCHIYSNHFAQVEEQLSRKPFANPDLALPVGKSILEYTMDDIVVENYQSHPAIKGKVAV